MKEGRRALGNIRHMYPCSCICSYEFLQIAQSQNKVYLNAENLMLNLQGFDLDET